MKQILINIDDDLYKDLIQTGENTIKLYDLIVLRDLVRNTKPLPKGHGRVVDVNEVIKIANKTKDIHGALWNAPTFIEADRSI